MKKLLKFSMVINLFAFCLFLYLIHALGGWKYVLFKVRHRGVAGVYEHKRSLFELMPNEEGEIIFLGNSITAGCNWAELFSNPKVKNRGIDGDLTEGVLLRLDEVLESNPTKIFLMIGVNDLISHKPAHVIANYKKILEKIRTESPETAVFVQSVLPVNNDVRKTNTDNENIREVNRKLKLLAQNFDMKYLDLHKRFTGPSGKLKQEYTSDGIHLNGRAYMHWKQVIENLVNE